MKSKLCYDKFKTSIWHHFLKTQVAKLPINSYFTSEYWNTYWNTLSNKFIF